VAKAMAVQERAAMRLRGRGEPPRGPRDDLDLENDALLAAAAAAAARAADGGGAASGAALAPGAPAAREADGLADDMDTEEDDAPEPAAPAPEAAQRGGAVDGAGARADGDAGAAFARAAASAPATHSGQPDGIQGAAPGLDASAVGAQGAAPGPAAGDPGALPGDDSDAETDSDGGGGGGGDPDVMPPPARRRRARAGAQDDDLPMFAATAWVPVSERPAFPPAALGLRPAFARAGGGAPADPAAAGELLAAWAFLGTFAGLLGLWPATLEELGDALTAGQASRLLGEAHVALLRLLLADMEEAHAGGALQVG